MYNKLINDRMSYRKAGLKDNLSTVSLIIGEVERGIKPTIVDGVKQYKNEDVVAVIKKLVKNWNENPELNEKDIVVATDYIPAQLTSYDLELILMNLGDSFKNIGEYMKYLKEHYSGRYDGKEAKHVWDNIDEYPG